MQQPEIKFHLSKFKAISHAISTYDDLNLLINHLTEGTTKTFNARGCCIMLLDEVEKQLFTVGSFGISEEYLQKGPMFVDDKYTALVTGKPIFIVNMQKDKTIQYPEAARAEGIVSMLSIPIKYREYVLGVIRIYQEDSSPFHEEDIDTLRLLGVNLGLVIEINGLKNFIEKIKIAMDSLPLRILDI
ncbi:MAG: GAF domain-containing protein [Desulfobacteraceae bacterium]|nr:GAF domain-containing protein [Desulfobacteraceae bacterium]